MNSKEILSELYKATKTEKQTHAVLYELELLLESAIREVGRFQYEEATELLLGILTSLQPLPQNNATLELHARTLVQLASIKRDQGFIHGPSGALNLYQRAHAIWRHLGNHNEVARMFLFLGACNEMQSRYTDALKNYLMALDMLDNVGDLASLRGRVTLRVGTVLTKIESLGEAESWIRESLRLLEPRAEVGGLVYAHQKLAILHKFQGKLDKALALVEETVPLVSDSDKFRSTQTKILQADLFLSTGEEDSALEALSEAEDLAVRFGFRHQLASLNLIVSQHIAGAVPRVWSQSSLQLSTEEKSQSLLLGILNEQLNLGEVQALCHRLGVDYRELSGSNRLARTSTLLLRMRLTNRTSDLIAVLQAMRPDLTNMLELPARGGG
jgi:tetratricopeptide (TPR) repeat protein